MLPLPFGLLRASLARTLRRSARIEDMAHAAALFDRQLLRTRRRRAAAIGPATFLVERIADDLVERLGAVLRRFDLAVDLGTPNDAVRRALAHSAKVGTVIAVDPVAQHLPPWPALAVAADEEALPFRDGSLALVLSALALPLVNDLPGAL